VRLWLILLTLLMPSAALAHPPRGIVASPDGRIFFSDLQRIWMIDPGGRASIVRRANGGHTHELFLAPDGSLYGEDSYYADGRYTSTLWRRDVRARFAHLFGPGSDPPAGLGVVRDERGCTYQSDKTRDGDLILYRRCGSRSARLAGRTAPPREFIANISGVAMGPGGFYFRRGTTVQRVDAAGRIVVAARGVSGENFGLSVGPDGSIYVAEFANRRIVRIGRDGQRSVAARSSAPWGPTGIAASGRGLHILEATAGAPTRMRVRSIIGGRSRVVAVVP